MSVLALFSSIKNLMKIKPDDTRVLTLPFHITRCVGIFSIVSSIFTSSKQFFGDPIQCVPATLPTNVFNAFCFMTGTKTTMGQTISQNLQVDEAHAGVKAFTDSDRETLHSYYQWVPVILFLQGVLFYFPYRLWKYVEGGKLRKLLVKVTSDPLTECPLEDQVKGVGEFLARNTGWYTPYASKMFFCQLGVLIGAVAQMYILDLIFDGQYFGLGPDATLINFSWEHYRVVEQVFPLVANCEMNYVGPSGHVINDSGMCVLAINILNQKIFLISWILKLLIITITAIKVSGDVFLFVVPTLRKLVLRMHARRVPMYALNCVHNNTGYGQFVLLMLIKKNMDEAQFETLINILAETISSGGVKGGDSSIHVSVHSTGKKYNEEYPLTGKQAQSPVITRRPRLMSG